MEFEAIYQKYFHDVRKFIFSLCHDDTLAEEITQEAFYKALNHLEGFDGRCSLYVWLCQIAKNTYFTYLKRQTRFSEYSSIELAMHTAPNPEAELIDRDTATKLQLFLQQLPTPYKEVFSLRVFGELAFAQIGALFDKSDSWARLVYYRAKKELRRQWDENSL